MRHIHLDRIISHESPPKIIKIFSEKEIKMIQELFQTLPERTFPFPRTTKEGVTSSLGHSLALSPSL